MNRLAGRRAKKGEDFLADPARTASAYGEDDYNRLRQVKRAYDPHNFFHLNHNIRP